MNWRSTRAYAVALSTVASLGTLAIALGLRTRVLASFPPIVAVLALLFVLWRRSERARAEASLSRERAESAREQAWQSVFLNQLVSELQAFAEEDDIWSAATTALGRALEASRVAAYERDSRGVYRLRAQFTIEGVAPLDEGSTIPASVVQGRELRERIARSDFAGEVDPELRALAAGLRVRSLNLVPVEREGGERSALAIQHCDAPKIWTDGEKRFLQQLSEHVAGALDRAKRFRRLSRKADSGLGLARFAQALAALRDASSVAEAVVSMGAPLAGAEWSALLVEDSRLAFRVAARSGHGGGRLSIAALRPRLEEAARTRAKVRAGRDLTLVPMFGREELLGILLLGGESIDSETAQSVADLASSGIQNARLFEAGASAVAELRRHWQDTADLAFLLDGAGSILEANAAASRRLGHSARELTGARLDSLLSSESATLFRKLEPSLSRGGRLRDQPLRLRAKDGALIDVQASASPGGAPGSVRLWMRDMTELRELERQLRQSQKLEVLGGLAGGIAHDFNNVLGGILGYASLLRTFLKDRPTAAKYVETIERAAVRGAELAGRLLSASRKSSGQLLPVDLNQVVDETLELLAHTLPKAIRIEKRLDPALHLMLADSSQLQQIVLNLCVNARDAMPDGGLLRVSTRLLGPEGADRVQVVVEDTGVGMDARTLGRLFEPFFSTKGDAGTGLGLSVVHGIVKALGGDVGVKSSPGRGARFEVVLPCRWADESLVDRRVEEATRGRGELILLVDDEKVLRDLGKEILEGQGYRVAAVASGEEALDYLEDAREVSLVILDVVMPGLGGSETYRRLRSRDASLPVLFSSGLTAGESVRDLLEEGGAGFIPKPYGIGDLTRAVSTALRRDNPTLVH